MRRATLLFSIVALMLAMFATPAFAAVPANDNFAEATVISTLPFSDTLNNTDATVEPGEPQFNRYSARTVWYALTPTADSVVSVDMAGSSFFPQVLNVYEATGPGLGGLSWLGSTIFRAQSGTTYYLQAGDATEFGSAGGTLASTRKRFSRRRTMRSRTLR